MHNAKQVAFIEAVAGIGRSWSFGGRPPSLPPLGTGKGNEAAWWRAAGKLANALNQGDERAKVSVRTARRIGEGLQNATGIGPKLVYHYTTMDGLKAIVDSGPD